MTEPRRCYERPPDDLPWFVNLCVTARCNLNCRMCQSNLANLREPDTDSWLRFFERLARWLPRPRVVTLTGGEPLLRDDLAVLVRALAKEGFEPRLNTNGILLTVARLAQLEAAGLGSLIFSFHGLGETHDRLRDAPGLYQGLCDMLEYASRHSALPLRAVALISAAGAADLPELVRRLSGAYRLETIHFQAIIPPLAVPWSWEFFDRDPLWPRDPQMLAAVLAALDELEQMKSDGWPINNPAAQFALWRGYFRDPRGFFADRPCRVARDHLLVTADGAVTFCDHYGALGTIADDPGELWRSPAAARLRENMTGCARGCNYRVNCCYTQVDSL